MDSADGLVTFTIVIPAVVAITDDDAPDPEPAAVGARHQPNG